MSTSEATRVAVAKAHKRSGERSGQATLGGAKQQGRLAVTSYHAEKKKWRDARIGG